MAQLRRLAEGVQSRLEVTLVGASYHKCSAEAWKYRDLQLDEVQLRGCLKSIFGTSKPHKPNPPSPLHYKGMGVSKPLKSRREEWKRGF